MTRETKVGLAISGSFLCLVGTVIYCQLQAGPPPETSAYAKADGSPPDVPDEPAPAAADGSRHATSPVASIPSLAVVDGNVKPANASDQTPPGPTSSGQATPAPLGPAPGTPAAPVGSFPSTPAAPVPEPTAPQNQETVAPASGGSGDVTDVKKMRENKEIKGTPLFSSGSAPVAPAPVPSSSSQESQPAAPAPSSPDPVPAMSRFDVTPMPGTPSPTPTPAPVPAPASTGLPPVPTEPVSPLPASPGTSVTPPAATGGIGSGAPAPAPIAPGAGAPKLLSGSAPLTGSPAPAPAAPDPLKPEATTNPTSTGSGAPRGETQATPAPVPTAPTAPLAPVPAVPEPSAPLAPRAAGGAGGLDKTTGTTGTPSPSPATPAVAPVGTDRTTGAAGTASPPSGTGGPFAAPAPAAPLATDPVAAPTPVPAAPDPKAGADLLQPAGGAAPAPAPAPGAEPNVKMGAVTYPLSPADQVAQATVKPTPGTGGAGDSSRPMPPVGAAATASSPPIPVPQAPGSGVRTSTVLAPQVESYDEETFYCKAPFVTFESISKKFYNSENYGQALLLFNRNHPRRSAVLWKDPSQLPEDTPVYIPPLRILEKHYSYAIKDYNPLPAPAVTPVAAVTAVTAQAAARGGPQYVVRKAEMISEIARTTLGNWERWQEIYLLNKTIAPQQPLPIGMVLAMPQDARIPAENRP